MLRAKLRNLGRSAKGRVVDKREDVAKKEKAARDERTRSVALKAALKNKHKPKKRKKHNKEDGKDGIVEHGSSSSRLDARSPWGPWALRPQVRPPLSLLFESLAADPLLFFFFFAGPPPGPFPRPLSGLSLGLLGPGLLVLPRPFFCFVCFCFSFLLFGGGEE